MIVYYISPAVIPSRTANSIHVVSMCEALTELSYDVSLFVRSEGLDSQASNEVIENFYGVSNKNIEVVTYNSKRARGAEFFIALRAFFRFIKDALTGNIPQHIISRNLYGAILLGLLLRNSIAYETHSPEKGIRKRLQKWLLNSNKIQTVVISEALRKILMNMYCVSKERIHVFHDAAREEKSIKSFDERVNAQNHFLGSRIDLSQYEKIVGYFGHLYSGRGIEIIQDLAIKKPNHAFVVYGGNKSEINHFRTINSCSNLFFMGHIPHNKVHIAMSMMNILLMPYQKTVSVGLEGVDTSQWMSPMKMFEYMSVGVPIISSDLPVIREVLVDEYNSLLVEPDNVEEWLDALNRISNSTDLEESLAINAYKDFKEKYTWNIRAKAILGLNVLN
jgi:glycosyltransferase involved in cell wall biosynthesis